MKALCPENKKKNTLIVLSLVIIFILMVAFMAYANGNEDLKIVTQNGITLSENWAFSYRDTNKQGETLPADLKLSPGTVYEATTVLPDVAENMDNLLLRSSMQDIAVYLNGEEIYRYENPQDQGISKPVASTWMMVKLPAGFQEKTLKLVYKSDVAVFSGVINDVKLGESSTLVYNVFKQSLSGFVVFLLLFTIGLLICLISLFSKGVGDNRFLYLGLLALSTGILVLSEARIMQFFTGNRYIIGGISYLMVPLMGVFFTLYVKETIFIKKQHRQIMQIIAGVFLLLLITTMLMQALGIYEFIELMRVTYFVILISVAVFIIIMYHETVKQKNENAKKLSKYMSVLVISILLEGIVFYSGKFDYTSVYLRIGILIFFWLLLLDAYHYLKKSLENQKERDLFENLAYKDYLTGAFNRAAFERDLEGFINKEDVRFRLVLLDLNELKYINDHYGHGAGDSAIKILYTIMNETFSTLGVCYRIGGDEFAILMKNTDEDVVKTGIQQIRNYLMQAESNNAYHIDVAIGTDVYSTETWSSQTRFHHHVDQKMYEDKLERKQLRRTTSVTDHI